MTKRERPTSDTVTRAHPKRARTDDDDDDSRRIKPSDENSQAMTSNAAKVTWGDWMGAHKTGADVDEESERIDRQKAAFGGDTVARIKDLNVLIVGCAGAGVEAAKNLILSNVGGVVLWDGAVCAEADRGTNFYVTPGDVAGGRTLAEASLGELRSLNPYCRVDVLSREVESLGDDVVLNKDVLGTRRPFAAIVVTKLLPKKELFALNETARSNGIAFIMAVTNGVTSSIFSDFGPQHEITDATGEPTQTLAVSNVEVLAEKPGLLKLDGVEDGERVVIVTVAQSDHGLEDGDVVVLEDMRDGMEGLNGKSVKVKRVAILSPVSLSWRISRLFLFSCHDAMVYVSHVMFWVDEVIFHERVCSDLGRELVNPRHYNITMSVSSHCTYERTLTLFSGSYIMCRLPPRWIRAVSPLRRP